MRQRRTVLTSNAQLYPMQAAAVLDSMLAKQYATQYNITIPNTQSGNTPIHLNPPPPPPYPNCPTV